MKALTLTQPWASLVAAGRKTAETRSWYTAYRGRLAIHAAKGFPPEARAFAETERALGRLPARIPRGAVLCIVELVDVKPVEEVSQIVSALERYYGDYAYGAGRWAWIFKPGSLHVLAAPAPAKGALGLWEWKASEVAESCRESSKGGRAPTGAQDASLNLASRPPCTIQVTDFRPPPAPDAGASFLGVYGLRNPWTTWLMRKAPELVALTPEKLRRDLVPMCPEGHYPSTPHRMFLRPEGWVCYRHPEWTEDGPIERPVRVPFEPRLERAPEVDVLSRLNEALDIVYEDGEWRVKKLELGD